MTDMGAITARPADEGPDVLVPAGAWRTPLRVRFSHCDPAGIVYFPRYFDLLNGVVEDWFGECLGLDYHDLIGRRRVGLGYASAGAEFRQPGFMGDRLDCAVVVERLGRSSLRLRLPVLRQDAPVLVARLAMVATSLDTHRSIPLPDDVRAAVERYLETCP